MLKYLETGIDGDKMSQLIVIATVTTRPLRLRQKINKISLICLVGARSRSHRRQLRQKVGLLVQLLLDNNTRGSETINFQTICYLT